MKVKSVEALSDDTFRLYTDDILPPGSPPRVGDLIVLRHNKHIHSGIFAENSTGIICESLTLYSCGEGLLFQFCRDVTCRNITIAPNRGIGGRSPARATTAYRSPAAAGRSRLRAAVSTDFRMIRSIFTASASGLTG